MADQRPLNEQIQERPISPESVLTDDQLVSGGLAPVTTWARTNASKNALRVAKAKLKKAEAGVKQLNVQAPTEAHEVLKAVAKAEPAVLAKVEAVLAGRPVQIAQADERRLVKIGRKVEALSGWRRSVVLWLLGL